MGSRHWHRNVYHFLCRSIGSDLHFQKPDAELGFHRSVYAGFVCDGDCNCHFVPRDLARIHRTGVVVVAAAEREIGDKGHGGAIVPVDFAQLASVAVCGGSIEPLTAGPDAAGDARWPV